MKDAHIHFNAQPYTLETIDNMVKVAIKNGVDELNLLDHTHKFKEFFFLYECCRNDRLSYEHYLNKKDSRISIKEYIDFIKEVRKHKYPVKINFGLEVCYFSEVKERLKEELDKYDFDFLIGSVHHVDGFAFDFYKSWWEGRDYDKVYRRYYEIMEDLICSDIFDHLAHPDSIKIFDCFPTFSLIENYKRIARLLKEHNMSTENNYGFARFGFTNIGLNEDFLKILREENVKIYQSSDAHVYTDIGSHFDKNFKVTL